MTAPAWRQPLHRALGLTDEEFEEVRGILRREPSSAELAMFAAMWSEHCSYKSSRVHLRSLPTHGAAVLVGPGRDAGAVDIGDGQAAVFKMESHSHPSAIEPYQGAATGVGGIVRDVISMGARPVALLDPLRFGPPAAERNRWVMTGVVAGIGGYGNCIGVPTVGGEIGFAGPHAANPTVNVMCVGIADIDRLVGGDGVSEGSALVLFGSATGRDGIGGVSVLASARLDERSEESRPSVQIGDPFAGKLLIEASLEMAERGLLAGLQDLGGAGLTCAVSESAARAGLGAEIDLAAVALREPDMEPVEVLTSESQERMLAIAAPGAVEDLRRICGKWGLDSSVIGRLVRGGVLTVRRGDDIVAELPARALADGAPEYARAMSPPPDLADRVADDPTFATVDAEPGDAFLRLLASPNVASKRWAFEQYDSLVQGNTLVGPGGDAAVVRVEGSLKALALSVDGKGRYGSLDPYLGGAHSVAEAARNVACAGATPVAITNCLNFGSPERAEVMWQFAESIRGMADACRALDTPVTGGNVSFYNESPDSTIWPTPIVGMLGVIEDFRLLVGPGFRGAGDVVYLIGETLPELGGSEFADVVLGRISGRPPALDLERERAVQRLLVEGARRDILASAHDCGDGGLAVALAESAMAAGTGFAVTLTGDAPWYVTLFAESASRAVVSVEQAKAGEFESLAGASGVPATRLGETGGPRMVFDSLFETTVERACAVYEGALPELLA